MTRAEIIDRQSYVEFFETLQRQFRPVLAHA
jgi:hypothetical protein